MLFRHIYNFIANIVRVLYTTPELFHLEFAHRAVCSRE